MQIWWEYFVGGGGIFRPAIVPSTIHCLFYHQLLGLCPKPPLGLCPCTLVGTSIPRPTDPDPLNLQTHLLRCITILTTWRVTGTRWTTWWNVQLLCPPWDQILAAPLHMVQLMQLPPIISCFIIIENGLPFWCQLNHQVVLEKGCRNPLSEVIHSTFSY